MNKFIDRLVISALPLSKKDNNVEEFNKYFQAIKSINVTNINISLDLIDKNMFAESYHIKLQKIYEYAKSYKLNINLVHAPYLRDFTYDKPLSELEKSKQSILKSCEYAKFLGAKFLVVHPGVSNNDISQTILDNYKYFLPIAQKLKDLNICLLFENNVNDGVVNGIRTTTPSTSTLVKVCNLFDKNGYKNTGICFDSGHANLSGKDVATELYNAKTKLKNLHLHDNYGDYNLETIDIWGKDKHNSFGEGNIDWLSVFSCFNKINYQGDITLEIKYPTHLTLEELKMKMAKDKQFIIEMDKKMNNEEINN